MEESWAMRHPTLETVLAAHEERTAIIEKDGKTFIDLELVCSLVDRTIQVNLHESSHDEDMLEAISPYLQGLATGTRFAAELLEYVSFSKQLEQME